MQDLHHHARRLEQHLRTRLAIAAPIGPHTTPDFPLAFDAPLPTGARGPTGHVGIRFEGLTIAGLDALALHPVRQAAPETDGQAALRIEWPHLRLTGRYVVSAKAVARIGLDTGGSMLELDEDIGPAGAPSEPPLDPGTRDAMLDRAREHRTRLMESPNGQQLMAVFNEHNEVFNTVFVNSQAARDAWVADGATRQMAEHTHSALAPDAPETLVVNPPGDVKTFGAKNVTYNENAFTQQLQIVVNTIAADPNFNPYDPAATPDPNSKFTKASLAALNFSEAVAFTGNDKQSVKSMTSNQVHQTVKDGTDRKIEPATTGDLVDILQQATNPGGEAAAEAATRHRRVLDEADRRLVRRQLHAIALERASAASAPIETLWSGACDAEIRDATAELRFAPGGESPRLVSTTLSLPAFEFHLDDSAWQGALADVLRERLSEAGFIHGLLREWIERGIADQLTRSAGEVDDAS